MNHEVDYKQMELRVFRFVTMNWWQRFLYRISRKISRLKGQQGENWNFYLIYVLIRIFNAIPTYPKIILQKWLTTCSEYVTM